MAASYEWETAIDNMRRLRIKANMKQGELGGQLGVSGPMVCAYERGKVIPRIDYVETFCAFFGIGIDDLYEPDLIKGVLNL